MSFNPPLITVTAGITTRNRAHILPKALESLRSVARPGLEVCVLDDASTDATASLAEQFPEFKWLRHLHPEGIIDSRNELMISSSSDFYLCLDDDAWFVRGDELDIAIEHLVSHPKVAGIAFDILSPDRPGPCERTQAYPVGIFIGCGHLLRLSAVREAGFYAKSPGIYGSEEKDLCLRLADLDRTIVRLPGVHVWHDKAWEGRDWNPLHRSGVCNEFAMTLRRCPLPDLLMVLPLKLGSFALFWFKRPDLTRAGLAGVGDFLTNFNRIWRKRAPVKRSTFWRFSRNV